MTRTAVRVALFLALTVTLACATLIPASGVHALIEILVPDPSVPVTIKAVFDRHTTFGDCERLTGKLVRESLERCPTCQIVAARCDALLRPEEATLLGTGPVPYPVGRLPNGAMAFMSKDPLVAAQACATAAHNTSDTATALSCFLPGDSRARPTSRLAFTAFHAVLPFLVAGVAYLVGWFILRYEHLHRHITHDTVDSGPQRNHLRPTPRIGGVQIVCGLLAGLMALEMLGMSLRKDFFELLLLATAPAFLGGLLEDVTRKVGVIERLLMTMLSGALGCWLLGAVLNRIDFAPADPILEWLPVAIAFTSFCVAGVANSVNIIDGFHGLASGLAIIACSAIAFVAWLVGDATIFEISLVTLGASFGFFIWNWPRGLIFLGDGGAYLLGVMLAELAILLVLRHPEVSAWFPILLLCHPITETLFSMVRRYLNPSASIGQPDNNHLHQKVFRHFYGDRADSASRNWQVAKFFWLASSISSLLAIYHFANSTFLAVSFFAYAITYSYIYRTLSGE